MPSSRAEMRETAGSPSLSHSRLSRVIRLVLPPSPSFSLFLPRLFRSARFPSFSFARAATPVPFCPGRRNGQVERTPCPPFAVYIRTRIKSRRRETESCVSTSPLVERVHGPRLHAVRAQLVLWQSPEREREREINIRVEFLRKNNSSNER